MKRTGFRITFEDGETHIRYLTPISKNKCVKTFKWEEPSIGEYPTYKSVMWINVDCETTKNKFLRGQKVIRLACINKKDEIKVAFWTKELGYQFDFLKQNTLSDIPLRDYTNIKQNLINELDHVLERNKYDIENAEFYKINKAKSEKEKAYYISSNKKLFQEKSIKYSLFKTRYNELKVFRTWINNSTDDDQIRKCIIDFENYFKRGDDKFELLDKIMIRLKTFYNPKDINLHTQIISTTRIIPFEINDLKDLGVSYEDKTGNYWTHTAGIDKYNNPKLFSGLLNELDKIKTRLIDLEKTDNKIFKWINNILIKEKETIERFIFVLDYTWDREANERYDIFVGLTSDYSYFIPNPVLILILHEINVNSNGIFPQGDTHVKPDDTKKVWESVNKTKTIEFETSEEFNQLYQSSSNISLLIFYLLSTFRN